MAKELLRTRDDWQRFDERLTQIASANGNALALGAIWPKVIHLSDAGRILTATMDVKLAYVAAIKDSMEFMGAYNHSIVNTESTAEQVLSDPDVFAARYHMYRMVTGAVLRFRALWDKVMGLWVLLVAPEQYHKYLRADSRKGYFAEKIAPTIMEHDFVRILQVIADIDNRYRTPEAHGHGTVRKFIFLDHDHVRDRIHDIGGLHNIMVEAIAMIDDHIAKLSGKQGIEGESESK